MESVAETQAEPELLDSPDLLILNGDIVTMDAERRVLVGGAVAIRDGRIQAVGSTSQFRARWPRAASIDARGGVVTPGMINAHQHMTGDPLTRSCVPDDLAPGRSIPDWSHPLHAAHDGDDDELSATLSAVDSLRNGVTTVVEAGTVADPRRAAAGIEAAGLRATMGTWGVDSFPRPYAAPTDEVLDRQRQVVESFPAGRGLVTGWVTLVGHATASDELLGGAADLARTLGVGMTMHLSPSPADPETYLARFGHRPVEHLARLGVLGEHLLLGHAVWLDDDEVELVLTSRTAVAYCPWAYLKLAQGVTRMGKHAAMHVRGGRIALGCDASNAGDQADVLRAAALAAGLARDASLDSTWFGAHEAFEMATIRGAEAIGMSDLIGSLEVGKWADVVIHRVDAPEWTPRNETIQQLVWSTDGRTVGHVLVGGRQVVRDGVCVSVDETVLRSHAERRRAGLLERAGLTMPHRWPHHDAY